MPGWVPALGWVLGLGLIAAVIAYQGADQVAAALATAGWGLALLGLTHVGTLLADTLGWRALLARAPRPSLIRLMWMRWISSSINSLLPVAQVGGEFVRARLLALSGTPGATAGASVVVDLTAGMATQAVFALGGVLMLLVHLGYGPATAEIGAGLALFGVLVVGFGLAQSRGLFLPLARMLQRIARGRALPLVTGGAAALDTEIRARYRDRASLARCLGWRLVGWLWGGVEIWIAFLVLGHPIGLDEAMILESLGQAVRSASFVVPGGLGAQEAGIVLTGTWLGIPAEVALAAALLRRARELAYGIPGLITWSWIRPSPSTQPAIAGSGARSAVDVRRRG